MLGSQHCHRAVLIANKPIKLQAQATKHNILRECKPLPRPKPQPKVIRNSNPDFRINPDSDPDDCRIAPKMLWIHYLAGINHFAEYPENRVVTVWEIMLISPIPQWEKWNSDLESVSGTTSSSKVDQFFWMVAQSQHEVSMKSAHYDWQKQAVRLGGRHNMPPPRDLDFWPFDLDIGVGVPCDLGYPCAKFRLPKPFGFRVRADVRDIRQTDGRTDRRTPMTA